MDHQGSPCISLRCLTFWPTLSIFLSPTKEVQALGPRICLRAADPRRAHSAGPQTEGNDQQEGMSGAPTGRLHRQPAGQGHGGDPEHPPGPLSGRQKSRKDVSRRPAASRLCRGSVNTSSQGRGLAVPARRAEVAISLPGYLAGVPPTHGSQGNDCNGPVYCPFPGFYF